VFMTSSTHLKPMFKWTGGKRREIPLFSPFFPSFVQNPGSYQFVEPFVGAGAVFWYLNNPNSTINDFDSDVMNLYSAVALQDKVLLSETKKVEALFYKNADREKQAQAYYALRNLDRDPGLSKLSPGMRAARFFVITQLAFSGMRRFNASGHFNVPFGHYKSFNASALRDPSRVSLLKSSTISSGDYSTVLQNCDSSDTFIFIDPPYTRVMKTYSAGNEFSKQHQKDLASTLASMKKASWMVVIDKSPLTLSLYRKYIRHSYPLSYGVNIRNRFSQTSEHIVATNYVPPKHSFTPTLPGI